MYVGCWSLGGCRGCDRRSNVGEHAETAVLEPKPITRAKVIATARPGDDELGAQKPRFWRIEADGGLGQGPALGGVQEGGVQEGGWQIMARGTCVADGGPGNALKEDEERAMISRDISWPWP